MNTSDPIGAAKDRFRKAYRENRLGHAHIVVGSPVAEAKEFTSFVLSLLFDAQGPDDPIAHRIAQGAHPDIFRVKPQSKSRSILIDEIRALNQLLRQTALENGWKVAIINYADRLNDQASNALLKSLEEPPEKTLILLVTQSPQELLPTVRSRCQWIFLGNNELESTFEWYEDLINLLRNQSSQYMLECVSFAEQLRDFLSAIQKDIENETTRAEDEDDKQLAARIQSLVIEQRTAAMKVILHWNRDVYFSTLGVEDDDLYHYPKERDVTARQAASLTPTTALRQIAKTEEMVRRLGRNMPPLLVFDARYVADCLSNR